MWEGICLMRPGTRPLFRKLSIASNRLRNKRRLAVRIIWRKMREMSRAITTSARNTSLIEISRRRKTQPRSKGCNLGAGMWRNLPVDYRCRMMPRINRYSGKMIARKNWLYLLPKSNFMSRWKTKIIWRKDSRILGSNWRIATNVRNLVPFRLRNHTQTKMRWVIKK